MCSTMDTISRFIVTSIMLLQALAILKGQNTLAVVAQAGAPYIVLGNRVDIKQMQLDGTERRLLQNPTPPQPDIRGIDFDFSRGMLYWSDVANDVIMQSKLDGTEVRTLVSAGLREPENIAWDWINQKLYWTDKENDTIKVYDPVKKIEKTLLHTGPGSQPRAIVVDPSTRHLYWTDWSDGSPRIVKTSMDGNNVTVLANRTWVTWPNALAIDYTNQVLYWGDASRDVIGRLSTNGSDIQFIANLTQQRSRNHPWAMSYYNGNIYWSDWLNQRSVHKMSVNSSNRSVQTIVSGLAQNPTGIHVVDASRQALDIHNPCADNNGGCSHLCLLSGVATSGFVCACPDNIQLNENGRHCGELPPATTTQDPQNQQEKITTASPPPSTGPCNVSRPCQNGATCLNIAPIEYFCVCIGGYSGRDCQVEPPSVFPGQSNSDTTNTVITAVVLIVGALIVVIVVALVLVIFVYFFYKLKSNKGKERSQSLSALSTTSSRDSPTHIVVLRNGRVTTEHDYASIKSRDSPAPRGGIVIYDFTNGNANGNPYVIPPTSSVTESQVITPVHRPMTSNGTLNGYLGSSVEKSDSSTKGSENEPLYSNIKSKTNTL